MSEVDLSQLAVDRSQKPAEQLRARRNVLTRYILPTLLIFGFLSLVGWSSRDFIFPPKQVEVIPVLATQSEVRSEGTSLFSAAGWIEPRPTAIRVAALASGVVEQLLVVEDQVVKQGEAVAELIKDDAQLVYDRAIANRQFSEAELERAEVELTAAKTRFNQPVHLQAKLAEADGALAKVKTMLKNLPFETQRAQSRLNFAERDWQRNKSAGTSVSEREIDEARTMYETTKAQLQELKDRESSLRSEETAIGQRREALNVQLQLLADEIEAKDRAEAQVKIAQARLRQMQVAEAESKLQLNRMTIKAPVDGRVYQLVGLPGARVGAGVMTAMDGHDGSSIITMYQPESLQVRVDVRFEDIPKVSLRQPVKIDNAALKKPITGSVLFISSEADIQKNTLQVKVAIDSPPEFFKPEMLLDVTFVAPKQANETVEFNQELRLYIPQRLVRDFEGQPFVWLADQSAGVAKRAFVTLGSVGNGGLVEVKEGLDVGSRIVSSGSENLVDGTRIRVTGEDQKDQ
ncbi:MAG: efflux RND transporter periplasmic adaptor subunit [Mariniblastus sp.]